MWHRLQAGIRKWPTVFSGAALLVWMGVIFAFSSRPMLPHVPDQLVDLLLKKGAHLVEYAVLAVLWWLTLSPRARSPWAAALAWVLSVAYAASDEYHQTFVLGRHGRLADVAIDALGALLGMVALWLTLTRRRATLALWQRWRAGSRSRRTALPGGPGSLGDGSSPGGPTTSR